MAEVKFINVSKQYDKGVYAVKNATITIPDKEFVIFVGPSGCGKSTMLRMIAGLENISSGQLFIGDKLMNKVHPRDRNIAMVFQNYALYPHMTVFDNMAFGLKLRNKPMIKIEEKVLDAAQKLGLTELLERYPKAMSGGQRQRVALGRSIVRNPKVFLLDEPLSNLDAKFRNSMRSEITALHKRLDSTFVYVTHDQLEAMTMGTMIVVMKDGLIQQFDVPSIIYDYPANLFVATFIGQPQMNIFDAIITNHGGAYSISFAGCETELPQKIVDRLLCKVEGSKFVTLGIRPENFSLCNDSFTEKNVLSGTIDIAEYLGHENLLHIKVEGKEENIILSAPASMHFESNQKIHLSFNADYLHLFDKDTTVSLLKCDAERKSTYVLKY